jgi:hypothetical protein
MNRYPLYTALTPKEVSTELTRLDELYKFTNRKTLPVELLMSSWGQHRNTRYGITLRWDGADPSQAKAAAWLKEQVKPTEVVA